MTEDKFTDTELMMISLVMSQQADQYGDPYDDAYRDMKQISDKARKMMSTNE